MSEESVSAEELRAYVSLMRYEGLTCPTCGQLAKVYRRALNAQMAMALIQVWRAAGTEWAHVRTVVGHNRADEAKLRYWGLIEDGKARREDGGHAGYWRVTEAGEQFIKRRRSVPKYALVYDGDLLGMDGPEIMIEEALADQFNYRELMGG